MHSVVDYLVQQGVLTTPLLIDAFTAIDRAHFVPPELQDRAYENIPLPIGEGQTISQPWTVAFMLELLQPRPGQYILDIGSGSGWVTALLAYIVSRASPPGHVYAMEIVPTLAESSKQNIERYGFILDGIVTVYNRSGEHGLPEHAPFDRITAAASAAEIPSAWIEQLALQGILVAPRGESLIEVHKARDGVLKRFEHPGFRFVPFVEEHYTAENAKTNASTRKDSSRG